MYEWSIRSAFGLIMPQISIQSKAASPWVYFFVFFLHKQSSRYIKIVLWLETLQLFFQRVQAAAVLVVVPVHSTAKIFTKGMKMIDGQDWDQMTHCARGSCQKFSHALMLLLSGLRLGDRPCLKKVQNPLPFGNQLKDDGKNQRKHLVKDE